MQLLVTCHYLAQERCRCWAFEGAISHLLGSLLMQREGFRRGCHHCDPDPYVRLFAQTKRTGHQHVPFGLTKNLEAGVR